MNDTLRQLVEYLNQLGQPDPQIAQQVAAAQQAAGPMDRGSASGAAAARYERPDLMQGRVRPGNIDLDRLPVVYNKDGSYSGVRSMGYGENDGYEHVVPTVSADGRIMEPKEAIDTARRTHRELGVFKDVDSSNKFAQTLHDQLAEQYEPIMRRGDPTTGPPNPSRGPLLAGPYDPPAGISAPDPRTVYSQMSPEEYQAQNMNQGKSLNDGMGGVEMSALQPDDVLTAGPLARGAAKLAWNTGWKAKAVLNALREPGALAKSFESLGEFSKMTGKEYMTGAKVKDIPDAVAGFKELADKVRAANPLGERLRSATDAVVNKKVPDFNEMLADFLESKAMYAAGKRQAGKPSAFAGAYKSLFETAPGQAPHPAGLSPSGVVREQSKMLEDFFAQAGRGAVTKQVTPQKYTPALTEELLKHLVEGAR